MNQTSIAAILLVTMGSSFADDGKLIYHPQGDAIVIENGTRWDNRPLYCHERFSLVWTGEMPAMKSETGTMFAGFARGEVSVPLQQFDKRIMRYRPGRMEWECSDARFPELTVTLLATALADGNGFTARIETSGAMPGDRALWNIFPPSADAGSIHHAEISERGFLLDREPANPQAQFHAGLSHPPDEWKTLAFADREDFSKAVPMAGETLQGEGFLIATGITDAAPQMMAMAADEPELPAAEKVADAATAWQLGLARAVNFSERLIVDTPDPYLNAGAAAAVAASDGIFVEPTYVHGGSQWRMRMPGWRTMGGSIYFGWLDRIQRAVAYWGSLQVLDAPDKTGPEFSENGCQQVGNSRFFGRGFINYPNVPQVYEFQTQFFDEAVRAWRASADPKLEEMLLPMLELHLERARECFDPDGDGLYESYNNTWPNDSIWFNGGGTPEQSAYIYYGHRAAADMYRRAGNPGSEARHNAEADRIKDAVNKLLWMPERGQFASYLEPTHHNRQMPDAWVYAQHIPIEAGMTTPEQAWKAMYYTEWAMERFHLPYGEMRQTANFLPGQWSIRELYHGDNFGMALGYFLAGQGDDGWNLMRGAMIETMFGDGVPKSGYSRESGVFGLVNHISPGGLSHPNCSIDFTDMISQFSRTLVEGLFGYRPDYPNGIVRMEPSFPEEWDRASIRTPDFALDFHGQTYTLELTRPAAVRFGLPVRADKVNGVTINGESAEFTIEPWAGYGMLRVKVPETRRAVVVLDTEDPVATLPVLVEEKSEGTPGHHLVINKIDGDVPRFQFTKIHIPETPETRLLREAPADAEWKTVDISSAHNGDLRTIFQQRYDSPRPNRIAMRMANDGWGAWTFARFWSLETPTISMENVISEDGSAEWMIDDHLVTPQHVRFQKPAADQNIAFTSQWDNWPVEIDVPVGQMGEAVWLLVSGNTTPMQGKITNAVFRFHYADGEEETFDIVPPENFWSLAPFGNVDYSYERDGFSLPEVPPSMVQLGTNCRAMVYGWKLRPGVELEKISLETLSQDVIIGLMAVSIMNAD